MSFRSNLLKADAAPQGNADLEAAKESSKSHGASDDGRVEPYNDDLIFDNVKAYLPGIRGGRYLLVAAIFVQTLVVSLAFAMHHYRMPDFDCCNMLAVVGAAILIGIQMPYCHDFFVPEFGSNPQWHRGNIFVPLVFMIVTLWEWGMGTVSMLAHAAGRDVLAFVNISKLSGLQPLAFVVCSCSAIASVVVFFVVDYTHRNNLGDHYYFLDEKAGALVEPLEERTVNKGSYDLSLVVWLVQLLQVDTALKAEVNLPKLITFATAAQVPFYVFAAIAYTYQEDTSVAPILIMGLGVLSFAFNWQYFVGAITRRAKKTRSWNRTHLWFPSLVAFIIVAIYFVTMVNMLFQVAEDPEDSKKSKAAPGLGGAYDELDASELAYLWINLIAVIIFCILELLVAYTHRKIWAEEREVGKGVRDPLEIRAEQSIFGVSLQTELAEAAAKTEAEEIGMEGKQDDEQQPGMPERYGEAASSSQRAAKAGEGARQLSAAQPVSAAAEVSTSEIDPNAHRRLEKRDLVAVLDGVQEDSDEEQGNLEVSVASSVAEEEDESSDDEEEQKRSAPASKARVPKTKSAEHALVSVRLSQQAKAGGPPKNVVLTSPAKPAAGKAAAKPAKPVAKDSDDEDDNDDFIEVGTA